MRWRTFTAQQQQVEELAEIRSEVSSLKENSDTDPVFCFFLHEGEEHENEERSNKGKIFSPDQQENVFL